MNGEKHTDDLSNPHDKLFRETWSNLENARSFLANYLPEHVLRLTDLESLEICKDSFVEKELSDYYSDMLYKVMLSGSPDFGFDLYDLTCFTDDEIKGSIMSRVVLLLFKHIFDPDLLARLPNRHFPEKKKNIL